jgi:hypothetical protein
MSNIAGVLKKDAEKMYLGFMKKLFRIRTQDGLG